MLVISRTRGKKVSFFLTTNTSTVTVEVEVRKIKRGKVTLAITAPVEVKVLRNELLSRP
ncbi:carbon storage regulator [Candidatus Peribacteria bacterium]|nr:carbon storage regulator [Candidatus Peribacteria bacterium]